MQILQSAILFGLVCLDTVVAVPSPTSHEAPKLKKRSVTFQRVAVGWKQRDVLASKVEALQKFAIPVSTNLKSAYLKNKIRSKTKVGHRKGSANANAGAAGAVTNADAAAGFKTVTVTVTAGTPVNTQEAVRGDGSGRRNRGGRDGNGNANGGTGNGTAASSTAAAGAIPTEGATNGSTGGTAGGNGTQTGGGGQAGGQTGEVENRPAPGDVQFLSEITIGGQKIVMNFDTGSSDLWVFGPNLPAEAQTGHTIFDPAKSPTFKAADPSVQSSFSIRFGDGSSASGKQQGAIGTDVVDIGGAIAQQQTIQLADIVSGQFIEDTNSNGLVGLAFSSINTVKPQAAKTFFDTIADDLEQPILAADLRPGAPGAYSFGEIDETAFTGQLTEVAIDNSQGFWQFESSTFSVGNNGQAQRNTENSPAIADTGTTLMLVDNSIVQGYYSQVQGAQIDQQSGLAIYPCSSTLPDLTVAIGPNHNAVIPGKLINFQAADNAGQVCIGGLQSNDGAPIQIFGDIFFKAQYTVFNIRNNTISVAPHS